MVLVDWFTITVSPDERKKVLRVLKRQVIAAVIGEREDGHIDVCGKLERDTAAKIAKAAPSARFDAKMFGIDESGRPWLAESLSEPVK